jgi:hypothetical protein
VDTYKKPKKTLLTLVILAVLAGLVIAGVFVFDRSKSPDETEQSVVEPVPQVTLTPSGIDYPAGWTEASEIAVSEKESGVTSVATKETPEARAIIREVSGERAPDFDISTLPGEIEKALSEEIEGFRLVQKRTVKVGGNDAVKVAYTQLSNEDQQIYHYEMYIIPTSQKTYYITYSTPDDIGQISGDITKVNQSLADYINQAS